MEYVVYASMCFILAVYHKLFWPTNPFSGKVHILVFLILALLFFSIALSEKVATLVSTSFPVKIMLFILFIPASIIYLRIAAFSVGTVMIISYRGGMALMLLTCFFAGLFAFGKIAYGSGAVFRLPFAAMLFTSVMALLPAASFLWPATDEPTTPSSDAIKLLIPPFPGTQFQTPYDLSYIPEKNVLAATFKMSGNQMLGAMNNPYANLIAFSKVSSGTNYYFFMSGNRMPECIDYENGKLYVTRVGYGNHDVAVVDATKVESPALLATTEFEYEPNGVIARPDGNVFVTGIEGDVSQLIADGGGYSLKHLFKVPVSAGVNMIDAFNPDGGKFVYLAMIGNRVTKLNLETGEMKFAPVRFGGGQIGGGFDGAPIFHTDIMFDALNVIDPESMETLKTEQLPYKPRPVLADPERNLLFIGAWLDGDVHIYEMTSLKEISATVHVGRYIRNFAYDYERATLFSTTMNGVYSIDVPEILKKAE